MSDQANWPPTVRVVFGAAGALLALKGVRTKGPIGRALQVLGLGLLVRSAMNRPGRRLVALGKGQRAIEIEKTIAVTVPVEQVWEVWSDFEAFPRFMSHLREVRRIDQGMSHWVAAGPAGIPVEWDAVITDWVPNRFIGWKSVAGSTIETSGNVRFRPTADGTTEIDVQLSYNPPAGAIGQSVATLLGADPKRSIDEDMLRIKSLLEGPETQGKGKRSSKSSGPKRPKPKT